MANELGRFAEIEPMQADPKPQFFTPLQLLVLYGSIAVLMLITRPYYGIWHDGILYTAQAVKLLYPENYSNDLFFMYGSQDNYTIFTNIYALFIDWFGLNTAAFVLVLTGQILWVLGAYILLKRLLKQPLNWIALASILVILSCYSYNHIFIVRENFVTPRLFAEGLILLSLAFLVTKQYILSGVSLLSGLLVHPLVGLTGLVLTYFWAAFQKPRQTLHLGLIATTLVITLGLFGISPVSDLFVSVDQEWFEITQARTAQLYTQSWGMKYWNTIILLMCFMLYAATRTDRRLGRITKATIAGTFFTLMVSLFASETLVSALLIQIQPWRFLWLTQFIALAGAAAILMRVIQKQESYIPATGFTAALFYLETIGGIVALLTYLYSLLAKHREHNTKIPMIVTLGLVTLGVAENAMLGWIYISKTISVQLAEISKDGLSIILNNYIVSASVILISFIAIIVSLSLKNRGKHWMAAITVYALFLFVISQWDMRTSVPLTYEDKGKQEAQLRSTIKPGETVYWTESPFMTWFMLHRSSYYSAPQTAGLIFNRNTAIEAKKRHININNLYRVQSNKSPLTKHSIMKNQAELSKIDIIKTCSDPDLDWLLLRAEFPESRMRYSIEPENNWNVYKCSDFRSETARDTENPK